MRGTVREEERRRRSDALLAHRCRQTATSASSTSASALGAVGGHGPPAGRAAAGARAGDRSGALLVRPHGQLPSDLRPKQRRPTGRSAAAEIAGLTKDGLHGRVVEEG